MNSASLKDTLKKYKINKAKLQIMKLKIDKFHDEQRKLLERQIDTLEYEITLISTTLESLKENEYSFINYKYFEGYSIDDLADKFLIGTSTVTRMDNSIINKMLEIINIFDDAKGIA